MSGKKCNIFARKLSIREACLRVESPGWEAILTSYWPQTLLFTILITRQSIGGERSRVWFAVGLYLDGGESDGCKLGKW